MLALQLQLLCLSSARMACGSHADRIWHHVLLYCCSSCCCSVVDYEEVRAAAAAAADEKIKQVRSYVAKFGQAQRAAEATLEMCAAHLRVWMMQRADKQALRGQVPKKMRRSVRRAFTKRLQAWRGSVTMYLRALV